jgi:hypothetical protein
VSAAPVTPNLSDDSRGETGTKILDWSVFDIEARLPEHLSELGAEPPGLT